MVNKMMIMQMKIINKLSKIQKLILKVSDLMEKKRLKLIQKRKKNVVEK